MATKSYKLRLDLRLNQPVVDTARFSSRAEEVAVTQRWLDDTREAFNAGVDYLSGWLLKMHRGAGICRQKKDGIWREWQEINTFAELEEARRRRDGDRNSFALLENHKLLEAFKGRGKSEAEAVELAECCRRIAKELCPPTEDSTGAQMPRSDLDLLTNPNSVAKGIRSSGASASHSQKKPSGRRPGWTRQKAIFDEAKRATSLDGLIVALRSREEFRSAKKEGEKQINSLEKTYSPLEWTQAQSQLVEEDRTQIHGLIAEATSLDNLCSRLPDLVSADNAAKLEKKWRRDLANKSWTESQKELLLNYRPRWEIARDKAESKRRQSEESGSIAAYRQLYDSGCLPLPGFALIGKDGSFVLDTVTLSDVGGEWKRAMWNMAGQRVRSHLGWVRRRAKERLLWELQTALFDRGGGIRVKRNGKTIKKEDLGAEDIRLDNPPEHERFEFQLRPAFGNRKWVTTLRDYESNEMPKHLEGVAFGAAEQPRILKKTAKGWSKVREKWTELIKKAQKQGKPSPSAADLMESLNSLRKRKSRDFGDQRFFEWLADPERRWLWDGSVDDCGRDDRDCVWAFVTHNEHLADEPKSITFTRSDPVKHPVWPYFGENSAVKYWLTREKLPSGGFRLVLVLKQLLKKQDDASYTAVDNVKIALRRYEDFEKSFTLPDGDEKFSAKQEVVFRDDLLGGTERKGTLSGMKLTWERVELEAVHRKKNPKTSPPRIYANFSCDTGDAKSPKWITDHVGSDVKLKKPRDGMTRVFFLKKTITKTSAEDETSAKFSPGKRTWPREAIENGFAIRSTDLGYRTSSAGVFWRLSFEKPEEKIAWKVGTCNGKDVYAVLERTACVSLPGDGEALPETELQLHDRLRSLRARLSLNNALLRIVRLLTLDTLTQRKPVGKTRKRNGIEKPIGTKWDTKTTPLNDDAIRENCRKAAEQLVRWATTEAMAESLDSIGYQGKFADWLTAQDGMSRELHDKWPTTNVPTEKQAKKDGLDREALKQKRESEDAAFAAVVYKFRSELARVLCDGYNAEKRIRAKSGLWAKFDRALLREISYSDAGDHKNKCEHFDQGLFRLLRKPPVTKHKDRKDDANNLPHGRTYRGGLSMARLNFLDEVKSFVRRWSCRPRWPGDRRRVPEDAKFDRCDTEHSDHLREHRAKLIAHADVAQTLGFEQDLRRGLWRFRTKLGELVWHRPERGHFYRQEGEKLVRCAVPEGIGEADAKHPHPAFQPAHVLVYEDLTRYRMSSDRPKNENAGLARWSHRRILAFAQHIGGLFGIPVATVDARFSSRYCSRCGAPGCRADRFDPAWLSQRWMRIILKSTDIRDAAMKSVAEQVRSELVKNPRSFDQEQPRPWVLRDGGTHFVCSNSKCPVHTKPIHADENAAANIGLRFLRGTEGLRVTVSSNGNIVRSIGYVPPGTVFVKDQHNNSGDVPFWIPKTGKTGRRAKTSKDQSFQPTELAANDEEDEESGSRDLFRDPSGSLRPTDHWFEAKDFWALVARTCASGIKVANASYSGSEFADED